MSTTLFYASWSKISSDEKKSSNFWVCELVWPLTRERGGGGGGGGGRQEWNGLQNGVLLSKDEVVGGD